MSEGLQDAAQKAAAIAMMIAQAIRHLQKIREQQEQLQVAGPENRPRLQDSIRHTYQQDRVLWADLNPQASDPDSPLYRPGAKLPQGIGDELVIKGREELRLWASAVPFAETDPQARRAAEVAEQRLSTLQPKLVEDYRERLAANPGDPGQALIGAAETMDNWQVTTDRVASGPDLSTAAEAAQTIAADEQQEAMTVGGRADDPNTLAVDERADGLARSSDLREHSVVQQSKAASLASQAQPFSIQARMSASSVTRGAPARPWVAPAPAQSMRPRNR